MIAAKITRAKVCSVEERSSLASCKGLSQNSQDNLWIVPVGVGNFNMKCWTVECKTVDVK